MTTCHPRRGRPRRNYHITVRGVRREVPDTRKLARALIALATAKLEAEAQAKHEQQDGPPAPETETSSNSEDKS